MTEHATRFVGPTTFRSLTHEKVAVGLFDDPDEELDSAIETEEESEEEEESYEKEENEASRFASEYQKEQDAPPASASDDYVPTEIDESPSSDDEAEPDLMTPEEADAEEPARAGEDEIPGAEDLHEEPVAPYAPADGSASIPETMEEKKTASTTVSGESSTPDAPDGVMPSAKEHEKLPGLSEEPDAPYVPDEDEESASPSEEEKTERPEEAEPAVSNEDESPEGPEPGEADGGSVSELVGKGIIRRLDEESEGSVFAMVGNGDGNALDDFSDLSGILRDIAGKTGAGSAFVDFIRSSDSDMKGYLESVIRKSWEKQREDGKDKMFSIFDYSLSILIAAPKAVMDDIRRAELLNNAGAVMYSRHKGSWNAVIISFDEDFQLSYAEERKITPSSFSPSDWKICRIVGEQLIARGKE